jgi:hypothetical protein
MLLLKCVRSTPSSPPFPLPPKYLLLGEFALNDSLLILAEVPISGWDRSKGKNNLTTETYSPYVVSYSLIWLFDT